MKTYADNSTTKRQWHELWQAADITAVRSFFHEASPQVTPREVTGFCYKVY
jgi:hypothetical protein